MAQSWAKPFYSSPAWRRNRKVYLGLLVDTDGHRLYLSDDGRSYYWVDEYGGHVSVPSDRVVPPGICERCYASGDPKRMMTPAKMVHHITWLNSENVNDPNITLGYDNFQRLCQDCHAAVHANVTESRIAFDEHGNVVWKNE